MITMKYKQFADRNFIQAIQTLSGAKLRFPGALSLKNMILELTKAQKYIGAAHTKALVESPLAPASDADEATLTAYAEAREKLEDTFGESEYTLPRLPLKYSILGDNYQISAQDLTFLAPLFEDLDVIPETVGGVYPISGVV